MFSNDEFSRNPLDAANAQFSQQYVAQLSNSEDGLKISVHIYINEQNHPVLEISAADLLDNYRTFIEVGECGCITKEFKSIANNLRKLADEIDLRSIELNEAAATKCCFFCDCCARHRDENK